MGAMTTENAFGYYVDGQWITEGERVEVRSPGTGEVAGVTYRADAARLEGAIAAAVRAV